MLFIALAIAVTGIAQGNGKNKGKEKMKHKAYKERKFKDKDKDKDKDHDDDRDRDRDHDNDNRKDKNKDKNKDKDKDHDDDRDKDRDYDNDNQKNKNKNKNKDKDYDDNDNNDDGIWDGTKKSRGGKYSKNQPENVRSSFLRDYPNARNVVWSKSRGYWAATFNNGLGLGKSTVVYHANGERRDTRTTIRRNGLPGASSDWDKIFARDNVNPLNIIQIQTPSLASEIFRITSRTQGSGTQYFFYNRNGQLVQYDY